MKLKYQLILICNVFFDFSIRILNKLKLNIILSFLNYLIDIINYRFVKSNHKDRIFFLKQSLKNIHSLKFLKNNKNKISILFIGDSHVEHYSRSNISSSAVWLGPCTVLGNYFQQNSSNLIKKILNISSLKNKPNVHYIAFSIASIDIRTIFYQLLIAKTVNDENDLFSKFEIGVQYLIDTLIKPLKINEVKILGIIELFNSSIIGNTPDTLNKIKDIKLINPYPTFGSVDIRKSWTKRANLIIKNKCNENDIMFFTFLNNTNNTNYFSDGIHISDSELINKLSENILKSNE